MDATTRKSRSHSLLAVVAALGRGRGGLGGGRDRGRRRIVLVECAGDE